MGKINDSCCVLRGDTQSYRGNEKFALLLLSKLAQEMLEATSEVQRRQIERNLWIFQNKFRNFEAVVSNVERCIVGRTWRFRVNRIFENSILRREREINKCVVLAWGDAFNLPKDNGVKLY